MATEINMAEEKKTDKPAGNQNNNHRRGKRHYYDKKKSSKSEDQAKVPEAVAAGEEALPKKQPSPQPHTERVGDTAEHGRDAAHDQSRPCDGGSKSRRPHNKKGHIINQQVTTPKNPVSAAEASESEARTSDDPNKYRYIPDYWFEDDKKAAPAVDPATLIEIVGVRFKDNGKIYYFAPMDYKCEEGMDVIVETARGIEFGTVAIPNKLERPEALVASLRPVVRIATEADIERHAQNKVREEEALRICSEKIAKHGLEMKLVEAEYTFDNSKLTFYFCADGRIDFRELVKDLAFVFRTRIELRQIGIRDEAKLLGGLGVCGRPFCCSTFLYDFNQVSIRMAKEQNLSLNSSKISGTCGRLMCCLRYECETYEEEMKRTPRVNSIVKTPDGTGFVIESQPLTGILKVKMGDADDAPVKIFAREDVTVIGHRKGVEREEEIVSDDDIILDDN